MWHLYRTAHGELPTAAEADAYDGFVITGSCNDAQGDDPWIQSLVAFLKALDAKKKKVLGVCFGHQILSRALGGKTGRAEKGWDIGVTRIHPSLTIVDMQAPLNIPSHLPVIEFHRDEVTMAWLGFFFIISAFAKLAYVQVLQLPPQAEVLAWSDKTGIEMFRYEDHILGIQGHPEYNKDIFLHLVDRMLQRNLIQTCQAEEAKRSIDAHELDREAWKRLCKGFLKGKLSW